MAKQNTEFLMKNHEIKLIMLHSRSKWSNIHETKLVMLHSQKWMQQHLIHIFVIIKEISKRNIFIRS